MADAVAIFTPGQRLLDASGTPYAGATITFYNAGSTDPRTVYADSELQTSLGSVVYTDSAGYPVTAQGGSTKTQVYATTGTYKIVIADSTSGETITHDDCAGAVVGGTAEEDDGITQAEADLRYIRNANALSAITDLADADILPIWQVSGSGNRGVTYAYLKTELTTDFRADGRMFPVGTRMVFQMTTPPTGWTKETGAAYDDATLRFETGTIGTGGTAGFNATFTSRTPTGTNSNITMTEARNGSHAHVVTLRYFNGDGAGGSLSKIVRSSEANDGADTATSVSSSGSNSAFTNTFTGNAMDFAAKYVEACVGEKS